MGAKLIVVSGKSAGKAIGLKQGKLLIGRADECDVRPLGEEVSRRHCLLEMVEENLTVKDLGSRNGTSVNGSLVAGRVVLADGDIVRVGPLELRVSCDRPAAPRPQSDGDDVSRWLMADDEPAGISDTTRSLRVNANESLPVGADDEEPVPAPVAAVPADSTAQDASVGSSSAIEAVLASKSQPGALPAAAKSSKSENSREAAAEALKKFFGKK
jgi:predicted component of type VI protein secretion system